MLVPYTLVSGMGEHHTSTSVSTLHPVVWVSITPAPV